jgi:hypothetical protein
MAKRRARSQIGNLTSDHQKSRIAPISSQANGTRHTVGRFSTRATTLLETSSQLKVYTQSYGPPKSWKSQLWEFQDFQVGVSRQNAIWMMVPWQAIEYIIRGKVVASPKSGPWWILWVRICLWLVLAPKVFQLCTNQLVVWFMHIWWVIKCSSFFLVPSRSFNTPLYPQSVTSQGACPDSLLFCCFHFKFAFESIKELGSASCAFAHLS